MRVSQAVIAGVVLLGGTAARATTINYITNGSFESNTTNGNSYSFANWTVAGTDGSGPGYGPEVFVTDGTTAGRYGDKVVSDNATSPYPNSDKAGNYAVYFVDDAATETLTQTIYLTAGIYEVGFDAYALASGFGNPNNATLNATIAGVTITSASVGSMTKAAWTHYAANVTIYAAGYYSYTFQYKSGATTAKDVLVDDVYVISPSTLGGNGTYVPEPASLGVLAVGVGILAAARKGSGSFLKKRTKKLFSHSAGV